MRLLRALVAALVAALTAAAGRVRVRWYRRQKLPLVREALAARSLAPASPPITALRVSPGPLLADDRGPDYLSVPSSSRLVQGRPAPVFRIASTRILPPPARELAVLRPELWNVEARRALRSPGFVQRRPGERAALLGRLPALPPPQPVVARPEVFGLDEALASTRLERALRGPHLVEALMGRRRPVVEAPRPLPRAPLGVVDPAAFGLDPDARPAALAVPVEPRHPPRLPRARATFHARFVDPHPSEAFYKDLPPTFGESVLEGAEAFFDASGLGGSDRPDEWDVGDELEERLQEVREQFTLRRDIDRYEYDPADLDNLEGVSTGVMEAISTFTGLEFVDLDPEPFRPLQLRLDAPPPDMAPFTESAERQLKWLLSAIKEHPPEGDGKR